MQIEIVSGFAPPVEQSATLGPRAIIQVVAREPEFEVLTGKLSHGALEHGYRIELFGERNLPAAIPLLPVRVHVRHDPPLYISHQFVMSRQASQEPDQVAKQCGAHGLIGMAPRQQAHPAGTGSESVRFDRATLDGLADRPTRSGHDGLSRHDLGKALKQKRLVHR